MRSEDQLLANKNTRRSRGLLFDNNWSSDRIIYGCLSSLANKFPILKFCIFYQVIAHVHFRENLSGYFLFSRFDWSIFVTQLVAKHMKEIICQNILLTNTSLFLWSSLRLLHPRLTVSSQRMLFIIVFPFKKKIF
jgi:hypothetical protein